MSKLGIEKSVGQVKRLLKKLGFKWKRYRKSLKRNRDEVLFKYFKTELSALEELAQREELDLLYFDGSGFNLNPNVPYGWLPKGQTITLPAIRGKGWTVLAALNAKKEQIVEAQLYEGAATSDCIIQFFDSLSIDIQQKTIVILDNASIHKAKVVQEQQQKWKDRGLYLQFIPAYSPELNKIEIFWKQMKHDWLEVNDYLSLDALYLAIHRCINSFGSKYRISFN